jgi:hypothetical protein
MQTMHTLRRYVPVLLTILIAYKCQGQSNQWIWAQKAGGSHNDIPHSMALDGQGNIWVAGSANDSSYAGDAYVVKYDASGNQLWTRTPVGNQNDAINCISTGGGGNAVVTGFYTSAKLIVGVDTLVNYHALTMDIFVAKYDGNGNVLWAHTIGGDDIDAGDAVTVDASGNIYVTGIYYSASLTFGAITIHNAVPGNSDIFLVKYDPSGNVIWAKTFGGSDNDGGSALATDNQGHLWMAGVYRSNNFTVASATLPYQGSNDAFLMKLDTTGTASWAKGITGDQYEFAYGLAVNADGNAWITGSFQSATASFGGTSLNNFKAGLYDVYLAKYDASGGLSWAKGVGGKNHDEAHDVAVDPSGNAWVTGYFWDTVAFGSYKLVSAGTQDIFIARYDATGNITAALRTGGTANDQGDAVVLDQSGNEYFAGRFSSDDVSFGSIKLNNNAFASFDFFTVKANGVPVSTGIADVGPGRLSVVFPNPSSGKFNVQGAGDSAWELYNSMGEKLSPASSMQAQLLTIDLSGFPRGIYFLRSGRSGFHTLQLQ